MPDDDFETNVDALAKSIVVGRKVFEQLYDPIIEPRIPDAVQFRTLARLRDRRVPNLVGLDKDQADFAEALRQAHAQNLLFEFFAKHMSQLFASPDAASVQLQKIVSLKKVFPPGLPLTMGRILALRRVCRILCETAPGEVEKGSGFLIGPHLVLTNWHVVQSMLDNAGKEAKDSHTKMKFEFDAMMRTDGSVETVDPFRPTEHWLVAASAAHAHETAAGGQGENAGPWPNKPDELAQNLDFAVIELNATPGYDRGWYNLGEAPWPKDGTDLDLFQFPFGRAVSYLTGSFEKPTVFQDNDKPPRMLHLVNAEKGSSGGLCLDMGSRAVALHQAGYLFRDEVDAEGKNTEIAVKNAAIPLAFIDTVAGQIVRDRIARAPRIERVGLNGAPIIGRENFQKLIDAAVRGNVRILTVWTSFDQDTKQPRAKIGKSFSADIMGKLLQAPDNIVLKVSSARLTSDAYVAARLIVETVNPADLSKVPAAPTGQTSLDADAIGTLIGPVIDAMRAAAGSGLLWLVIDDLDRSPVLNESTTSTFLDALYKAVAAQTKLRIVLIGPVKLPPGLTGLPCGAELIEKHVSNADVANWITGQLGARIPVLPQVANLLADITRSVANEMANDPLLGQTGAIAQVLRKHLSPRIEAAK